MIRLGETFNRTYTFTTGGSPRDLSGIVITFHIDDGYTAHEFPTDGTAPDGIVTISLTAVELADVQPNNGAVSWIKFDLGGGEIELKVHRTERIVAVEAVE